ncbi:hypothetical protein [Methylobacterium sp. C1]|uniref:hypothetical protein n=1 Tax=Methylobacterium sp. C1 TaxID=1479019 RepID=UPI0008D8EDB1|nr:hypothetical protein [Methylobacterium sp. C1]
MRLKFTGWETVVAALAGVGAGYAMPNSFYGDGAAEIVTVLGFLIAALVPAMALGATVLRAGGFSVLRIQTLGFALDRQIRVFAGLFLYSLAACILAIAGKLMKWAVPSIPLGWAGLPPLDLSFLFPAVLTALFVFLTLRAMAFVTGILSILRLSTSIAADEARSRDQARTRADEDALAAYEMPEGYGSRIELPH